MQIVSTTKKQSNYLQACVSWKRDAGETVDYDQYAEQVKKLLDKHVVGVEVKADGVYEVGKMGKAQPEDWSEEKTRNETEYH
jgi:type I restriction enzyme R subunit